MTSKKEKKQNLSPSKSRGLILPGEFLRAPKVLRINLAVTINLKHFQDDRIMIFFSPIFLLEDLDKL